MNFDAFISYSHRDKVTSDAACAALEAGGIRCWIAPRDVPPGADWAASLVDAIDQCSVMVLIFSANANASKQVQREVQRAFDHNVPVIPLRIENVAPAKALAFYMGPVHWLDALTPPLEEHLKRLADSVRALLRLKPTGAEAAAASAPQAVEEKHSERMRRANLQNSVSDMAGAGSNHLRRDIGGNRHAELGCALDLSGIWSGAVSYKAGSYNYEWFMTQEGQHVSGTIALSNRDGSRRSAYFFVGDIRENKLYFRGTEWFSPPEAEWCIAAGELYLPAPGSSYNELRGTWGPGPVDVENPCPSGGGEIYLRRKEPL